jgi:hypothetical protein
MRTTVTRIALVISMLLTSTTGFSGVARTVCSNEMFRVCIEEPNSSGSIKLLAGESRHFLDEVEPYRLYVDQSSGFSFNYDLVELMDSNENRTRLVCAEYKPGTCSGWNF